MRLHLLPRLSSDCPCSWTLVIVLWPKQPRQAPPLKAQIKANVRTALLSTYIVQSTQAHPHVLGTLADSISEEINDILSLADPTSGNARSGKFTPNAAGLEDRFGNWHNLCGQGRFPGATGTSEVCGLLERRNLGRPPRCPFQPPASEGAQVFPHPWTLQPNLSLLFLGMVTACEPYNSSPRVLSFAIHACEWPCLHLGTPSCYPLSPHPRQPCYQLPGPTCQGPLLLLRAPTFAINASQ